MLPRRNCWEWNSPEEPLHLWPITVSSKRKLLESVYLFSQERSSPSDCVDMYLVCGVSLLITKAKPEKLTQNNHVTFFFALTELIWTTRIFRQAPRLSYTLVCGIRIGILGCIRINCYEMELIIAVYSSPGLPNVSSQKTVGLIRRGMISHN